MWRKKRDSSRAVISERPQIARSRWKRRIPTRWAVRSIFAAPRRTTTVEAARLLERRIIGLRMRRSSLVRSRERTSGWRR